MVLHIAGRTDVGRTREHNEDAFIVADLETMDGGRPEATLDTPLGAHGALLMVADGMGGAAAGEVASAMATARRERGGGAMRRPYSPGAVRGPGGTWPPMGAGYARTPIPRPRRASPPPGDLE